MLKQDSMEVKIALALCPVWFNVRRHFVCTDDFLRSSGEGAGAGRGWVFRGLEGASLTWNGGERRSSLPREGRPPHMAECGLEPGWSPGGNWPLQSKHRPPALPHP